MTDSGKTKEQLIEELVEMRRRLAETLGGDVAVSSIPGTNRVEPLDELKCLGTVHDIIQQ